MTPTEGMSQEGMEWLHQVVADKMELSNTLIDKMHGALWLKFLEDTMDISEELHEEAEFLERWQKDWENPVKDEN